MKKYFDVIVVGAGYAGLCASYHLQKKGMHHTVFERGKIAESWRSQRWDNFRFNSTNKLNVLPGEGECDDPDAFATAPAFVHKMEQYSSDHNLPVEENSEVICIEKEQDQFLVKVQAYEGIQNYFSKQILVASGACNKIIVPSIANNVSKNIIQLHTAEYKNESQLPDGAVLVVGGAQSGIQITEDLLNAGRKVFFSTSRVGRFPRWYRGQDIFYWVKQAGFYDITAEQLEDPKLIDAKPPHISGTGDGKTTLSLQSVAKRGAIILGKLERIDGVNAFFESNASEHVRYADEISQRTKKMVDDYIEKNNLAAPVAHSDIEDMPDATASCASSITSLNLEDENINSIVWATGFGYDLSYIGFPIFNEKQRLLQKDGSANIPGLYFLGYPWLRSRKSPILFGIAEDAEHIVNKLYGYAKTNIESKLC